VTGRERFQGIANAVIGVDAWLASVEERGYPVPVSRCKGSARTLGNMQDGDYRGGSNGIDTE
jgi:hypothetical protein